MRGQQDRYARLGMWHAHHRKAVHAFDRLGGQHGLGRAGLRDAALIARTSPLPEPPPGAGATYRVPIVFALR